MFLVVLPAASELITRPNKNETVVIFGLQTQTCRTKRSLELVPGCRGVGAVLADGVACLHSAQAEPWLGSGRPQLRWVHWLPWQEPCQLRP